MICERKRRLGNEGSAFVVVLICMLVIGIIAAIVLGLAQSNLKNIGTGMKSSDNFYEAEEAVDELKDSLKQMANEAVKKAYEDYLQLYAINSVGGGMTEEQLKMKFNELFSQNIEEELGKYFRKGSSDATQPANDYKDLLYKYNIDSITTEDEEWLLGDSTKTPAFYVIDPSNNVVSIKNIKITFRDADGHLSTITTDLSFDVTIPSITVGSNVGLSTSVADFALISDHTVKNSGTGSPIIMGSIYGGGQSATDEKDADGKYIYDEPGLLFSNSCTAKLFSNMIISRTSLATQNGANVEIAHSNEKRAVGIVGDYYSSIWVNNILMDGTSSSKLKIQGTCNVADDLTIDSDGSTFELAATNSQYYGFNTNKRLSDGSMSSAETSSSIVINGSGITLDLSKASKLWLAGKSYVEVPSIWGYKDASNVKAPTKTF